MGILVRAVCPIKYVNHNTLDVQCVRRKDAQNRGGRRTLGIASDRQRGYIAGATAMYPHSPIWHYLWVAPHTLQVAIVVIMIRRRLISEFPVFLTYTLFQIIMGGTLFVMDH